MISRVISRVINTRVVISFLYYWRARRARKQANWEYLKAKQKLADGLRPTLVKLSVMINYRDRPSVVELAHAAQVVYACRFHKIEGCEVELGLIEAWVRYWDEEKISR